MDVLQLQIARIKVPNDKRGFTENIVCVFNKFCRNFRFTKDFEYILVDT